MSNGIGKIRRWLMSIDQPLLLIVLLLIGIGVWVSIASTPAVAIKLGLNPFCFVKRHIAIIPFVLLLVIGLSTLQPKHIRLLSCIGYSVCILLVFCTLFFGTEIKGARRWLNIFGFSLQPSEFLKPIMSVITAWLISKQYVNHKFNGIIYSFLTLLLVTLLLLRQPDVGMAVILISTWMAQLFISGLSVFMITFALIVGLASLTGMYFVLPHVAERINNFMFSNTEEHDLYQVEKSLEAFQQGGLFGKGPGEGTVKMSVPDCHSDFVFSVIGEEFGFFVCLAVIILLAILIIRPVIKSMESTNLFCFSAIFGLSMQIMLQTIINIGSTLHLIPTKGMTLQFISYGGSSMLSSAVCVGFLLALTKYNSLHEKI